MVFGYNKMTSSLSDNRAFLEAKGYQSISVANYVPSCSSGDIGTAYIAYKDNKRYNVDLCSNVIDTKSIKILKVEPLN
jgi:hypothetical protein